MNPTEESTGEYGTVATNTNSKGAAQVTAETVDMASLMAQLEAMRAENERLKAASGRGTSFKVSEKGAVSVYGLGRFPTTLYPEQWERLLTMGADIKAFIADNTDKLKWKRQAAEASEAGQA